MSLARYANLQIGQKKSIIKGNLLITIDCITYKLHKCYKVVVSKIQTFKEMRHRNAIHCLKQLYSMIYQDLSMVVL